MTAAACFKKGEEEEKNLSLSGWGRRGVEMVKKGGMEEEEEESASKDFPNTKGGGGKNLSS